MTINVKVKQNIGYGVEFFMTDIHSKEIRSYNMSRNQDYWVPKLTRNTFKDKRNEIELKSGGWNIITVWECDLKKDKIENTFRNLLAAFNYYPNF